MTDTKYVATVSYEANTCEDFKTKRARIELQVPEGASILAAQTLCQELVNNQIGLGLSMKRKALMKLALEAGQAQIAETIDEEL